MAATDDAYAHCAGLVKALDKDRWLAALFAPEKARPHLHALHAFNLEVARVREAVRDPLPGEMRLRWWADLLEGRAHGEAAAHPVARALLATVEACSLPRAPLIALVEARMFDLYDDPPPTLAWLDGYCGETSSALLRLAQLILARGAALDDGTAAGKAGIAIAVTGLLRALPWHAARGKVFVPAELMERHGVARDDVVRARGGPGVAAALADMRSHALQALAEAKVAMPQVAQETAAAFLTLALVVPYLARMERQSYDPFRTLVDLPTWRKIWRMWREA